MVNSVLVVEDDRDIREGLCTSLGLIGVHAITAHDGSEALKILSDIDPPCLILLDLMMPVMDGWEFRVRQQQDAKIANVPVIVITADGNASEKARRMGAFAGLKKPLELSALFDLVKVHCHS